MSTPPVARSRPRTRPGRRSILASGRVAPISSRNQSRPSPAWSAAKEGRCRHVRSGRRTGAEGHVKAPTFGLSRLVGGRAGTSSPAAPAPARRCRPRPGGKDQPDAEIEQIGGADPFQRQISEFGCLKEHSEADRDEQSPGEAAEADAERRRQGAPGPFGGGSKHQSGIETRRDREQGGGEAEGNQRLLERRHGGRIAQPRLMVEPWRIYR